MQPGKTPSLAKKNDPNWKPSKGSNAECSLNMKYNESSHGGGLVHHPSHESDKHLGLVHRVVTRPAPHKEPAGMAEESEAHEAGETAEDEAREHY